MTPSSPTPRRITSPSWLDLRLVLGVVLVLASVVIGARVVSGARHTDSLLALTHDLAAGSTVQAADLTRVQAHVPDRTRYLAEPADAVGKRLDRPLAQGELLPVAAVDDAPSLTTVSVPLTAGSAPALRAGQRIELWLSTKTCRATVLLADATIQQTREGQRSYPAGAGQDVILSLASNLAERVITALGEPDATLRAGVLTGAAATGANDALPTLAGCIAASHTP